MKTEFFMGNLPGNLKKDIQTLLSRGVLPRSGDFSKIKMQLPTWDKHQWKTWAENNGVDLPDDFLNIVK